MSRLVQPELPGVADSTTGRDGFAARVAKYVPTEVISAYLAMLGFAAQAESAAARKNWYAVILVAGLIATPLYLSRFPAPARAKRVNIMIAVPAFAVWAYALGGWFSEMGIHDPTAASILLILFTLLSGAISPPAE